VARSIGAADWVLRNITDQLNSFQTINTALTVELATLPADQRARVTDAAAELRKARAIAFVPINQLRVRPSDRVETARP
jgi:hypothetical protein